tara:strand:+ start:1290 stop:1469 length:180 start_codon:yes stop_codon:yes gene_type:complete
MKTTELELSQKELGLLLDAMYSRWSGGGAADARPESLAAKLIEKLYYSKQNENTNNDKK